MKIRRGLVSNSSSSSFIVVGSKPKDIPSIKLAQEMAESIVEYIEKENSNKVDWDKKEDIYLTRYVSDSCDEFMDSLNSLKSYEYLSGSHGGPYSYDGEDDEFLARMYSEEDPEGNDEDWNAVFVRKVDMSPEYKKNEFMQKVKELSNRCGIKKY